MDRRYTSTHVLISNLENNQFLKVNDYINVSLKKP